MSYSVYEMLLLFLIYSFLGWCTEVCFAAVTHGTIVNRGFLNGPVCPIYGVGMLGVLTLLTPVSDNVFWLFFLGMVICSLIELIGGWVLEKVFHTRWWDYTGEPLNLGGYVCLKFSILWGLAVAFVVRLVHPLIFSMVTWLPHMAGWILIGVLYGGFVADFIVTLTTIVGLRRKLTELEQVAKTLHAMGDMLSSHLGNSALAAEARLEEVKEISQEYRAEGKEKLEEAHQEVLQKKTQLEQRRQALLRALADAPKLGTRRLGGAFPNLKQSIHERVEELRNHV